MQENNSEKNCGGVQEKELVPNWAAVDAVGVAVQVWDFRQKAQVVFIHEPQVSTEIFQAWMKQISDDKKLWTWLNAQFLRSAENAEILASGIYIINRYGQLIRFVPSLQWTFKKIEEEFIYHEACSCG